MSQNSRPISGHTNGRDKTYRCQFKGMTKYLADGIQNFVSKNVPSSSAVNNIDIHIESCERDALPAHHSPYESKLEKRRNESQLVDPLAEGNSLIEAIVYDADQLHEGISINKTGVADLLLADSELENNCIEDYDEYINPFAVYPLAEGETDLADRSHSFSFDEQSVESLESSQTLALDSSESHSQIVVTFEEKKSIDQQKVMARNDTSLMESHHIRQHQENKLTDCIDHD